MKNLTHRQKDVLYWIARGKTNAEIGGILHISPATIKNHVQRIIASLGVTSRESAVFKAYFLGLMDEVSLREYYTVQQPPNQRLSV